jgi:hypothetical protein
VKESAHLLDWIAPAAGALFVVALGKWLARRQQAASAPAQAERPNS